MKSNQVTARVSVLLIVCTLATVASAQQASGPVGVAAGGSNTGEGRNLEEVIVTAQRRSETIKDVPFSVSAIGQDQLEQGHITNIEDVTRAIPGVSFGTGAVQGQDNITIRGIGSQTGNSAIGLYLDDVPIVTQNPWQPNTYTGASEPHFFDMNRIEVLRGPQGTLYGASSLGGAIRYISNPPDLDHTTATFSSDLSDTHHGGLNYDEQAIFNFVVAPGFSAIRFGIDYGQDSGWINHDQFISCGLLCQQGQANSVYGARDQRGVNSQMNLVMRLSGEVKPSDDWSMLASMFYQKQYSRDTSLFYTTMGLWNEDKLVPERGLDTMYVPSITVNGNLGWADLTSVSSLFLRQNKKISDGTYYNSDFIGYLADFVFSDLMTKCPNCGVAFDALPGPAAQDQTTQTTSQELRLASKTPLESGRPFSWIGGLFWSNKAIHVTDNEYITGANALFTQLYGEPLQNSSFGVAAPNDDFGWANVHEDERQYAAFGEFTYDISKDLKAAVGDRLIIAHASWDYNPGGFFTTGISEVRNSVDYHANTPKFAIDYKLSDDVSLYANATKGYRLGGFVEPVTVIQQCSSQFEALGIDPNHLPGTFKADHLWSYEVGEKSTLLDHHLSVNAAAYYIDWSQIQQSFVLPCGAPYTANFGTARSHGGELEILGKLTQDLTLGLNAGATHAYLTSVSPNVGASAGQDLLNTPSWSASLTGQYERPINDATRGFVRADYDWVGPSHGNFSVTDPDYVRPTYSILNATAGLHFGNVEVSLYGKNLLSDYKVIQHVLINSLESGYTLRPLTVGIKVIVRLGEPRP
jgi:iron complex outermembrane receptor protein